MKTYIVNAAQGLTLPAGALLRLTDEQARVRQVAAITGKRGHYRLTAPTMFKRGEQIGLAEAPSKGLALELLPATVEAAESGT